MSRKITPKTFLRDYRKALDLSADDIAAKLGVSASLVFSWENGGREVTPKDAIRIEKTLGIDRSKCRPDLFLRRAA